MVSAEAEMTIKQAAMKRRLFLNVFVICVVYFDSIVSYVSRIRLVNQP